MDDEKMMAEPEDDIVTLVDEDGGEHDFEVIDILEVDGKEYAILLPLEEGEGEAVILRIEAGEEGNEILVDIEDDEEWERVADAWEEKLAEEELDED